MSNERMPIGIEGSPTTKISPIGIVILVVIIVLACVAVYYYSPGLYEKNEEEQGITATFNDAYSEDTVDSDNDRHYDYLKINVGVNVSESGKYAVDGSLYVGYNTLYSSNTKGLSEGIHEIILSFNGLDIYLNRVNGSYQLRNLTLRIIKGNSSFKNDYRDYAYNTSFYNYTDFQNSVHIDKTETITGSSSDTNLTSDEYSFDVKKTAATVTVRVDYDISKVGFRDSWIDLYIYYGEENESSESKTGNDGNTYKIITLNAEQIAGIGYGKWVGLIHHYNDPGAISTTGNTASYTLTIDVVYE
jgi:hypothetical protein